VKLLSLRLAVMLAGLAFVLFLTVPPTQADEWNLETKITPDHQIEVPGAVLEANTTYIIALMDSPYERKVVRVYNGDRSHVLTQFIAISAEKVQAVDDTAFRFIEVPAGHPVPIEQWFYPGRRIGLEFLYSNEDRDKFAGYWREQRPTEVVAEVELPAPAPVIQPSEDLAVVVEEPKAEPEIAMSKPTEPEPEPVLQAQAEELPRTAGELELFGLIGALTTTLGVGLRLTRR
jgi:hypothetical protein